MIKAILFDLDGVLVDATEWHYLALNKALNLFGYKIDENDHINIFNGLPTNEKLKILSQTKNFPVGLHPIIKSLKKVYTDEIVNNYCRPNHSKELLLCQLKESGYILGCCSNAQKYSVLNMLTRSNLLKYFDLVLGNDDGYQPKPSPDIYLAAFEKLKIKPEETVIIEDSPHGIEAAKSSKGIVIPVKGFDEVTLSLFENMNLFNQQSTLSPHPNLSSFPKGWLVGDFDPSLFHSKDIEVAIKKYQANDSESRHVHKIATEFTIIIKGKVMMNDLIYTEGDIVKIPPNQSTDFICLEDTITLVIKTPSVPSDKYIL